MEDDWKTVEVFLRSAHEVRDHAYSTIRVSVSEAGEFVEQVRIGAGIRQPAAGANGVLNTFPHLPESSANKWSNRPRWPH